MDTKNENEEWQGNYQADNSDANRDGNRISEEESASINGASFGSTTPGEQRPHRPRINSGYRSAGTYRPRYNSNNGDDGGQRPYRPRYNSGEGEDGAQRPYRPRYNGGEGEDGGQRPYRPRFNQGGGYRPHNDNGDGTQRPYRPRFNGGEGEDGGQRPYRPRFNQGGGYRPHNDNGEGGQRPYRPRFNSGEGEDGGQRPYRPRFNGGNRDNGGYRPRYNQGGYGRSNDGEDGGQRPYRPRFNGGRPQQGGYRPRTDGYNPNAKYSVKKQIEYKEENVDPDALIRLNKYLANAGICSRREADEFIQAGVVSVNGAVVTELGTKVKRSDEVKFHDQSVKIERKIYVLLNKPKNCVTTSDDPQERHTVMELVKDACKERIYPVGRLDRNTTGVLLLTNDGDLASKLTHPKFLKKKIYHVTLDKNVTRADLDTIVSGVTLEDGEVHADAAEYASEESKSEVGIEIHSGKNRIVRRIFESLGYKVIKLDRVFFAGLTKKGLRRGEWRYLTETRARLPSYGFFRIT
jgi:23S rRNA pseudouridine2605 synthase